MLMHFCNCLFWLFLEFYISVISVKRIKKLPLEKKYLFHTPYASVSDSNFSKIIRFLTIDNFGNR